MKIARGPAARRPYFGVLELELELLLEAWDPIGVYGDSDGDFPMNPARRTAHQHEYDDLVRPIIAHLVDSDDGASFAAALRSVIERDYGLTIDAELDEDITRFAAGVVGWWRSR